MIDSFIHFDDPEPETRIFRICYLFDAPRPPTCTVAAAEALIRSTPPVEKVIIDLDYDHVSIIDPNFVCRSCRDATWSARRHRLLLVRMDRGLGTGCYGSNHGPVGRSWARWSRPSEAYLSAHGCSC